MTASSHETQNTTLQSAASNQPATADAVVAGDQGPHSATPHADATDTKVNELGGPKGPEPTRFGDWERKGRCVDF